MTYETGQAQGGEEERGKAASLGSCQALGARPLQRRWSWCTERSRREELVTPATLLVIGLHETFLKAFKHSPFGTGSSFQGFLFPATSNFLRAWKQLPSSVLGL